MDQRNPSSTLFTLDDIIEGMELESIDTRVVSAFEALNNAMGMLWDVIVPTSQVLFVRVPRSSFFGPLCF